MTKRYKLIATTEWTTSQVPSIKISIVNEFDKELKYFFADPESLPKKIKEARELIDYMKKLDDIILSLLENGDVDDVR